jgi:7-keto-8-aminopelargonate synthetase-like enzyme
MTRVDSTTLLGVVGIAGTLLGTLAGAGGVLGAARVTSRGQAEVEEQRARRQAYSACSTALLARRDAAITLLNAFSREDDFDLAVARARMQDLDDQRAIVARGCRRSSRRRPI